MKLLTCIKRYLVKRRQKADLLAMDAKGLSDLGISRADAEYHCGHYRGRRPSEKMWKAPNEK